MKALSIVAPESPVAGRNGVLLSAAWAVAAGGLFLATGAPIALGTAFLAFAALVFRRRFILSPQREGLGCAAVVALGLVWPELAYSGEWLPKLQVLGSLAPPLALVLCLLGVFRLTLRHPLLGQEASWILLVLAMTALGEAPLGKAYGILVLVVSVAGVASLPGNLPPRGGWSEPVWWRQSLGVRACGVAAAIAGGMAALLPALYDRAADSLARGNWAPPVKTGLSSYIALGREVDIQSDQSIVLRVRGEGVDYLRGAVLQRYVNGHWLPYRGLVRPLPPSGPALRPRAAVAETGRAELIPAIPVEQLLLPLNAAHWQLPEGARSDDLGVLLPAREETAERVSFALGARDTAQPALPSPRDLAIPDAVRVALLPLAKAWVGGVRDPVAQMAALVRHLRQDYRYSLKHQRETKEEPVVDFLLHRPEGHCEFFASALALLARTLEIPSRVVLGYRVWERNPWGNWTVVRERDAHAWVEIWLPGAGWVSQDPTPPAALAAQVAGAPGIWTTAWDWCLGGWSMAQWPEWTWDGWGPILVGTWVGGGGLSGAVYILFRHRRSGRKLAPTSTEDAVPRELAMLLEALARAGISWSPSQPLERLAASLAPSAAAIALQSYAAYRYGGQGDWGAVAQALRQGAVHWAGSSARLSRSDFC